MRVALVNTNRIRPPIGPVALDYLAETVAARGRHTVEVLDLCWEDDAPAAIARFCARGDFSLAGITLRNTDDCAFASRHSFLPDFAGLVAAIRVHTDARLVLGGVGFSTMPEAVLELCGVEAGIWGEGEFALAELADRLEVGADWRAVPGLVWRAADGLWRRNPAPPRPLAGLPPMTRRWIDNARYYREGGQAGFETKRGCPGACIYCADPVAKGRRARLRPPGAVVDELERLHAQGIDHLHTCDSEFNLPPAHAAEICREVIRRGLGNRLRWYAYCAPAPFTAELAGLMRRAGCVGINFGADHGDAGMLRRLRRAHGPDDIVEATRACREAGIAVMLDLLLGAPGESRESLAAAVELMRQAGPDRVGVSAGVRVYPGTELAQMVRASSESACDAGGGARVRRDHTQAPQAAPARAGLLGGEDVHHPLFFLEPAVAPFIFPLLDSLIGDDPRFLFFDPSRPDRNYNYNANQVLVDAIARGARGAYWDILRRA